MNSENCFIARKHSYLVEPLMNKQPLSKFEPQKPWKYKQLWGLRPTLAAYEKSKCILKHYLKANTKFLLAEMQGPWKKKNVLITEEGLIVKTFSARLGERYLGKPLLELSFKLVNFTPYFFSFSRPTSNFFHMNNLSNIIRMGYSRKNQNREGESWGYGTFRGIKEIACGISRG